MRNLRELWQRLLRGLVRSFRQTVYGRWYINETPGLKYEVRRRDQPPVGTYNLRRDAETEVGERNARYGEL